MTRAAIYARYSSELQSENSIDDQVRLCRAWLAREGIEQADIYSDSAISGATLIRAGVQDLIAACRDGKHALVVTESLDRLSRDQEHIAAIYKQLTFAGVRIVTVADGEISELHIGLKGTMGALYLKDLAAKTHRGLEGRVRAGRSGGGNSYGYDVVDGEEAGGRNINKGQAAIVRGILADYAGGASPRAIAIALNKTGVDGPSGKAWGSSTIAGSRVRGTGILNNELYIGRMVWNRLQYRKDPLSGKRVSRPNPEDKWVVTDMPALRIVEDDLWAAVKARQDAQAMPQTAANKGGAMVAQRRPKHLLTGLVRCGECGGGFVKVSKERYGCATRRNKGTCSCRKTITEERLEETVLDGMRKRILHPAFYDEFAAAWVERNNQLGRDNRQKADGDEQRLGEIDNELSRLIDAIATGTDPQLVNTKIHALKAERGEIERRQEQADENTPILLPSMIVRYRGEIESLYAALHEPRGRPAAVEEIRALIDHAVVERDGDHFNIRLVGRIETILKLAMGSEASGYQVARVAESLSLVAGGRNKRYRLFFEALLERAA